LALATKDDGAELAPEGSSSDLPKIQKILKKNIYPLTNNLKIDSNIDV